MKKIIIYLFSIILFCGFVSGSITDEAISYSPMLQACVYTDAMGIRIQMNQDSTILGINVTNIGQSTPPSRVRFYNDAGGLLATGSVVGRYAELDTAQDVTDNTYYRILADNSGIAYCLSDQAPPTTPVAGTFFDTIAGYWSEGFGSDNYVRNIWSITFYTAPPPANFTLHAYDNYSVNLISNFSATINGTTYNTINGTLTTGIMQSEDFIFSINITSNGYFNMSLDGINMSTDLSVSLIPELSIITGSYNMSSDGGCISWRSDETTPCPTTDGTPEIKFNTTLTANCSLTNTHINYSSSYNCGVTDTLTHTCDLNSNFTLSYGLSNLYIGCNLRNQNATSEALNINMTAGATTPQLIDCITVSNGCNAYFDSSKHCFSTYVI